MLILLTTIILLSVYLYYCVNLIDKTPKPLTECGKLIKEMKGCKKDNHKDVWYKSCLEGSDKPYFYKGSVCHICNKNHSLVRIWDHICCECYEEIISRIDPEIYKGNRMGDEDFFKKKRAREQKRASYKPEPLSEK